MNDLVVMDRAAEWRRLKALVLDSVSSPITKRVYNLGLGEFFKWYEQEPRSGFTKATVSAWRVALEARGRGSVSFQRPDHRRPQTCRSSGRQRTAGAGTRRRHLPCEGREVQEPPRWQLAIGPAGASPAQHA